MLARTSVSLGVGLDLVAKCAAQTLRKITLLRREAMDQPFSTKLYQMEVMPYGNHYFGFITAYHGETIQPIPPEKEASPGPLGRRLARARRTICASCSMRVLRRPAHLQQNLLT